MMINARLILDANVTLTTQMKIVISHLKYTPKLLGKVQQFRITSK
jgi:hypothetical protein